MRALLIHGMGRTPISQMLLARRLRQRGFEVQLFGYWTFQSFDSCVARLTSRIASIQSDEPFILVGHSLGCVLIRAALPRIQPRAPLACFFLAPPSRAPRSARFFAKKRLYRWIMGEAGQLLADEAFMTALPLPTVPVKVYAGTAGWKGRLSPFQSEENDGVLMVSETALTPNHSVTLVPAIHTFIMNSTFVANDIAATVESLASRSCNLPRERSKE